MNKGIDPIVKSVMLALALMLILGSQACEEKKIADQAPDKVDSAAPTTDRAEASASSTNTADDPNRDGATTGGSK